MDTAIDDSQVSPIAGNGAGGHALAAIEPLEGLGAVLASCGPLSTTSQPETSRQRRSAHTPTTGPISRRSASAMASRRSRPAQQTLALYLKAFWRASLTARRPVSRLEPSGSRYGRCAGDSRRSRAATRRPGSRRLRSTPSCAGFSAATAAPAARPFGRRSRS